jgi:hypothetical protein
MGKMKNKEREREIKRNYAKREREKFPERCHNRRRKYELNHQERSLVRRAKKRASMKGVPFSLTEYDIKIPEVCPVLGIPLFKGTGKIVSNSPSLDEIIPGIGYVVGNVQVISNKANAMKSNATPDELRKFADWITKTC